MSERMTIPDLLESVTRMSPQSKLRVAIGLLDRDMPEKALLLVDAAQTQLLGWKEFGREHYEAYVTANVSDVIGLVAKEREK